MSKAIFVTATGTDVGKTYVSALLVKKMKGFGCNCGYYKPVLSGAEVIDGKIIAGDCNYVKNIANLEGTHLNYLTYVYKNAVSPHLASKIENNPIKLEKIKEKFENIKSKFDYIVVEGAGGIVCPMNLEQEPPFLIEDIIKGLALDVIIVAPAALGSINSAVMTVEYAHHHGITVKGIILNQYDPNDTMQKDNKLQIEKLTKIPVIATVTTNDKDISINKELLLDIFKEI